ncbi:MAG TPA: sigma-70 family RNA polymerase sigma factor [Opitutaceae bacterium]|nr:sigma-70 family RNA polymerase sigma factor [Opitutaceae bacterium]
MVDDAELLRRYAQDRSEEAFTEFVQRHLNLVYAAALRRLSGDSHRAADVAQIVFTAAARDAARLSRHAALTGWLYSAARNASIDAIRSEHRREQREQAALFMHEAEVTPPSGTTWEELRPVLDDAMDELDERDRDAVLQRYFEGTSFGEIARKLSLSEDAARMRVSRAIERLRALLARRGVTSTSAALSSALIGQASATAPAGLTAFVTSHAFSTVAATGAGAGAAAGAVKFSLAAKPIIGFAAASACVVGAALYYARVPSDLATSVLPATAITRPADPQPQPSRTGELGADPAAKNSGSSPAANSPVADPVKFNRELQVRLHSDAEMMRLNGEEVRALSRFRYASLHAALGMSGEQIERFETLLAERAKIGVDLAAARYARGWEENDPAFLAFKAAAVEMRARPLDDAIRTLLGPAGYQQYREIKPEGAVRTLLNALAAAGEEPDAGSTSPWVKTLPPVAGAPAGPEVPSQEWMDLNWDEVIAQAQGVMSQRQINVLHALRDQALRQQEILQRREQIVRSVLAGQTRPGR